MGHTCLGAMTSISCALAVALRSRSLVCMCTALLTVAGFRLSDSCLTPSCVHEPNFIQTLKNSSIARLCAVWSGVLVSLKRKLT